LDLIAAARSSPILWLALLWLRWNMGLISIRVIYMALIRVFQLRKEDIDDPYILNH
jgi:hypothetical protein